MKFEQYIPCRRFVEHLAGAARQRALGRCSSDDGGARAPAVLGGDGRKRGRAGIGRGSLRRSPGCAGGGGGAAGRGWKRERKSGRERSSVPRAVVGARNTLRG